MSEGRREMKRAHFRRRARCSEEGHRASIFMGSYSLAQSPPGAGLLTGDGGQQVSAEWSGGFCGRRMELG